MKNNTETKRIYLSNQLVAMLPPTVLKLLLYFIGWQSSPEIKFNIEQLINILHLTEDEINIAVQTLYDHRLMRVNNNLVEFNREQIQKYYDVPFSKVIESKGIQLSKEITWNKPETPQQKGIEDMNVAELKTMLLNITARLNEHEATKRLVVNNNEPDDGLPW